MSEQTEFTAFRKGKDGEIHFLTRCASSVGDFMQQVQEFYGDGWLDSPNLIAWAPYGLPEFANDECDALCADSIAAGRTIELIDGRYVARGVEESNPESSIDPRFASAHYMDGRDLKEDKFDEPQKISPKNTPLFDHLKRLRESGQGPAAVERARPALDWNQPAISDRFPGFTVKSCTNNQPKPAHSPLTTLGDSADPKHGSAFLKPR